MACTTSLLPDFLAVQPVCQSQVPRKFSWLLRLKFIGGSPTIWMTCTVPFTAYHSPPSPTMYQVPKGGRGRGLFSLLGFFWGGWEGRGRLRWLLFKRSLLLLLSLCVILSTYMDSAIIYLWATNTEIYVWFPTLLVLSSSAGDGHLFYHLFSASTDSYKTKLHP